MSEQTVLRDDFTVSVEYVRLIAEQLRRVGVDVDAWLARAGLEREPDRQLPLPAFRRLVLGALEASREPAFGLFVGERLTASTHGMVGFAAINSSTAGQALAIAERFAQLRSLLFSISHEVEGDGVRVMFTPAVPLNDIERPLLEAVVLSIKNVLDAATMGACAWREVAFPFAEPKYASLARDMFGCKVRYGCDWAGFAADVTALALPIKLADAATYQEAADICQRELDRLAANATLSARVRRILLERQQGFPTLAVTARMLHMTPRTLHRRLVKEGTSFRELLESVRHVLAIEHLKSDRFNVAEIAYRLGYTDLANFRRAFKRWESVPPSVARSRISEGA